MKQGIVIIDTPGVGGLFKKHRDITFRYAPNADAVFFITDSIDTVINEDEINFLKELLNNTNKVAFVQTKTDAVDTELWKGWRERNLDILSSRLELTRNTIPYFPVSSKIKKIADEGDEDIGEDVDYEDRLEDLADSGFLPVIDFLNNVLIPNKEKIQATEQHYTECLKEYEEWRNGAWHQKRIDFGRYVQALKDETQILIQESFTPHGIQFKRYIDELREELSSVGAIRDKSEAIVEKYALDCTEKVLQIQENYLKNFKQKCFETLKEGGSLFDIQLHSLHVETHNVLFMKQQSMDINDAGGAIMAGTVVGTALYYVAGTALTLGAPVTAPVALGVVVVGGVIAGLKRYNATSETKKEQAFARLEKALSETTIHAQTKITNSFRSISQKLDYIADDQFVLLEKSIRGEIEKRLHETQDAKKRTFQEAQQESGKLRLQLNKIIKIDEDLKIIQSQF